MKHEIDSQHWPAFCERLSRQRAGATLKLEVLESNGVKTERFPGATFHSMIFDKTDPCSDVIALHLRTAREIVHEFIDPVQLRLHRSESPGSYNQLQIEAESGVSFLTFHPAISAQMLEELNAV